MNTSGIETSTFPLIAQYLKKLRYIFLSFELFYNARKKVKLMSSDACPVIVMRLVGLGTNDHCADEGQQ
jgi:hypothetical protein